MRMHESAHRATASTLSSVVVYPHVVDVAGEIYDLNMIAPIAAIGKRVGL